MARIIDFKQYKDEKAIVFAKRTVDSNRKPVEEWDGNDWGWLLDFIFGFMVEDSRQTKWDYVAEFMRGLLIGRLREIDRSESRQDNNDLKSMAEWDREDWEWYIDVICDFMTEDTGRTKWDVFSDSMREMLTGKRQEEAESCTR